MEDFILGEEIFEEDYTGGVVTDNSGLVGWVVRGGERVVVDGGGEGPASMEVVGGGVGG